jgi:hypothetical protein
MRGIISQSNFIPWRGYFASARLATVSIFYDSQQFTRRDWRNRNILLANHQPIWLTLPVKSAGEYLSSINKIQLVDEKSVLRTLDKLKSTYRGYYREENYKFVASIFEDCRKFTLLSEVNWHTTKKIAEYLEIDCRFESDQGVDLIGDKNEKLISACKYFKINHYLSGPSAIGYLDTQKFEVNDINVEILNFSSLPKIESSQEPSIIHWILTQTREKCIQLTTFSK